jgi:hypothetical protein
MMMFGRNEANNRSPHRDWAMRDRAVKPATGDSLPRLQSASSRMSRRKPRYLFFAG